MNHKNKQEKGQQGLNNMVENVTDAVQDMFTEGDNASQGHNAHQNRNNRNQQNNQ